MLTYVHAACSGKQSYVLSLRMSFTPAKVVGTDNRKLLVPVVVAVSHTDEYNMFSERETLNDAAAEIAKTGRTSVIEKRFRKAKREGKVESWKVLEDISTDKISKMEIRVKDDASRVSLMAALSPTDAYFVGLDSFNLCGEGDQFVPETNAAKLRNYDGGLYKPSGDILGSNQEEYEEGKEKPVSIVNSLKETEIATLFIEEGVLGVNWWKILLGVLIAVAVLLVLIFFVYPKCRRKRQTEIPLANEEGVDW